MAIGRITNVDGRRGEYLLKHAYSLFAGDRSDEQLFAFKEKYEALLQRQQESSFPIRLLRAFLNIPHQEQYGFTMEELEKRGLVGKTI